MKLFFYSLILTNNNLLLKIYCKNIVVGTRFVADRNSDGFARKKGAPTISFGRAWVWKARP